MRPPHSCAFILSSQVGGHGFLAPPGPGTDLSALQAATTAGSGAEAGNAGAAIEVAAAALLERLELSAEVPPQRGDLHTRSAGARPGRLKRHCRPWILERSRLAPSQLFPALVPASLGFWNSKRPLRTPVVLVCLSSSLRNGRHFAARATSPSSVTRATW